ncbi:MAG TPA: Ku protein [Noviherbaspirillum sp.]|uniref:non-homologous end joining protein Ku n=1 Tax=Noviherbaspirillum sp. TaxID=1926288 RepID=UPI002D4AC603|nr:Ku protein [Noviherbaspirillum sp.]HYD93820.1 Ku protein [Noviherbaspirillum sp.]
MPRSIADLTLSFGLVSIPVKVYAATEAKESIHFNMIHKACGSRIKQQLVCIKEEVVVERKDLVKGYEFAPGQYVIFAPEELKELEETGTHMIDIVGFVPAGSVDPVYYEKAYYLAPDKRGDKPYLLLLEAMRRTGRAALARWTWKGKSYTVQVRPSLEGGLVLQQLLYAEEVRSFKDLNLPQGAVSDKELDLAMMLVDQIATDFDPGQYRNDFKYRLEAAIEQKIEGQEITLTEEPEPGASAQVIDLMEALRASLSGKAPKTAAPAKTAARKSAKKAGDTPKPAPAKKAARKTGK